MDFNADVFAEAELREIEVLTGLLAVLSKGVVKPNDPSHLIRKMRNLESELSIDLTDIINCCPASNVVYEAKDYIDLRMKVLRRIESKF